MAAIQKRKLLAALIAIASCTKTHASDDPMNDLDVQKNLRGIANSLTWYHADLFCEFAGLRAYAHHEYASALKYFEIGALYADKLSQLSLGLMYMNGEGVPKDPVTAHAWLDLAAERDYPQFVGTRDNLKATMTTEQLAQAVVVRAQLVERYADAVAKTRLGVQLKLAQMQLTGSHLGFDSGVHQFKTKGCEPTVIAGGQETPQAGCGGKGLAAKERWDPDLYFASRDREYKATVTVGSSEATTPKTPRSETQTPVPQH